MPQLTFVEGEDSIVKMGPVLTGLAALFGPGGEGAPAVVEWVSLADVATGADVREAVARDFCA